MASQTVSMKFDEVENIAKGFQTASDALEAVSKALDAAIALLHASAILGGVGEAAAQALEQVQLEVKALAEMAKELNSDVTGAIKAIRDNDTSGSQRFVAAA